MSSRKEPWYLYAIVTTMALALTYFAFTDYESFVRPETMSSGKAGKIFILIFGIIDFIGGKSIVLIIMSTVTIALLIKTIRQFRTRLRDKPLD